MISPICLYGKARRNAGFFMRKELGTYLRQQAVDLLDHETHLPKKLTAILHSTSGSWVPVMSIKASSVPHS